MVHAVDSYGTAVDSTDNRPERTCSSLEGMRALIAIFLFPIFLLIFLFAMTINQVLSTVASEDLIVRILDEANIYDYFYDELLTRLSIDLLEREYEVSADRDGYTFVNVLSFDEPDLNPKSL